MLENNKELKLHIGCGTVYLEGYVNVHPNPDGMACLFPEEVEVNKTTVDNYYKTGFDARPKKHIADLISTLDQLPYKLGYTPFQEGMPVLAGWTHDSDAEDKAAIVINTVDEICMFHVLEHIPLYDLDRAVESIVMMLKPGGRLRVAVPDFDGIVAEYAEKLKEGIPEEEKEWYFRFVHGTQKDKYSHHYCGYNRYRLIELLKRFGFDKFEDLPNQNFYPAIHLMAYKEIQEKIPKNFNSENINVSSPGGKIIIGSDLGNGLGVGLVIDESTNTIHINGSVTINGRLVI